MNLSRLLIPSLLAITLSACGLTPVKPDVYAAKLANHEGYGLIGAAAGIEKNVPDFW